MAFGIVTFCLMDSKQCQDNPYGFNGVVVYGDGTYRMTQGCIPDMTGYLEYLTRSVVINENSWNDGMTQGCIPDMTGYLEYLTRRGFSAGVIHADHQNNAPASRQMLPMNAAVTESAISAPMDTSIQLGAHHMGPSSTDGYALQHDYGWGGNGSQLSARDEENEEEEKNLKKKKKAKSRRRKRSRRAGH